MGSRQAGVPDLKLARLARDREALLRARELAAGILAADPGLASPVNAPLDDAMDVRPSGTSSAGCSRPERRPRLPAYTQVMRTPELIATHSNTDFDAFAAMVAVHKLYPEAQISLGGAVNRNVREFQALLRRRHPRRRPVRRGSPDGVRRLILVDTVHANRLGDLGDLCGREGVQVVAFDHHAHPGDLPDYLDPAALVSSATARWSRCWCTSSPSEASRSHRSRRPCSRWASTRTRDRSRSRPAPRATPRRLRGACARGADTELLEKWLTNALTPAQRITLAGALQTAVELPIAEATVLLSALREDLYVEGVSVVAHRVMDLTGCDAYFLLVEMEGRVFVTARSRGGRLDVADALRAVGGGGHTAAASAVVKDGSLDDVAAAVAAAAPAVVAPTTHRAGRARAGSARGRRRHLCRRRRPALPA